MQALRKKKKENLLQANWIHFELIEYSFEARGMVKKVWPFWYSIVGGHSLYFLQYPPLCACVCSEGILLLPNYKWDNCYSLTLVYLYVYHSFGNW